MLKTVCNHRSEKNRTRYNAIRNKTKKVVTRAMRMEAKKKLEAFSESPNTIFMLMKLLKKEGKDFEGEKGIQEDIDGRLDANDNDRKGKEYGNSIWRRS